MKRFRILCLVLGLLSVLSVFSLTACGDTPDIPNDNTGETNGDNDGDKEGESNGGKDEIPESAVEYKITVDASDVEVELAKIGVCLYTLDGTLVTEKKLSGSVAKFQVEEDIYVASLSGLTEEYTFSSVLLKDEREATIVLEESKYNEAMDISSFKFTLFVIPSEGVELDSLFLQVCSDLCRPAAIDENGVASITLTECGEYEIKVEENEVLIFHEFYTITLDKRFYVVHL